MEQRPTKRTCGPCTACCKPWAVPEVQKFDATWCRHRVEGSGCGIYHSRPVACKKYACVWLNGKGEESDRPDLLNVIMDAYDARVDEKEFGVFHFWEMMPNALRQKRVDQLAEAAYRQGFVVIYHRQTSNTTFENTVRINVEDFTPEEIEQIKNMRL